MTGDDSSVLSKMLNCFSVSPHSWIFVLYLPIFLAPLTSLWDEIQERCKASAPFPISDNIFSVKLQV